jgi:hypothetical protein
MEALREITEKLSQYSSFPVQDSNRGPLEWESKALSQHRVALILIIIIIIIIIIVVIVVVGPPMWSSGGPSSIPGTTRKKVVGLEQGPLSLVRTTEELLERKVAAPV